jgi:hypothetical protein
MAVDSSRDAEEAWPADQLALDTQALLSGMAW